MADATIWGIHAGATGDADALFLQKKGVLPLKRVYVPEALPEA